jgi:Fe-S cluster assembly protein SufD
MTTIAQHHILEQFLSANTPKSGFAELRAASLDFLQKSGLPKAKEEEYKYTPITKRIEQRVTSLEFAIPAGLTASQVKQYIFEGYEGDVIVFDNGHFVPSLSAVSSQGYHIQNLSELSSEILGQIALLEKDPFVALNNISFEDGVYLEVAKNEKVKKPILFLHINNGELGSLITPRIYISCNASAEVTFLETTVSVNDSNYLAAPVTEIHVSQNAKANFYRLQAGDKQALEVNNFVTDIHRDATFTSVVISLDADMIRNNLTLNLKGSGCEGNMYGLYLINGKSHVDNHTNVDHTIPHAQSNELYKGILADESRGVFNGKIFVRQDAQKTNAFQQNNNILLSDDAIVNTKPQLEIWADDVKCSHGCTTGQLDEEALFYLQARGIKKSYAKGLLLFAFANEVLEHIQVEAFAELVANMVEERLGSKA